MMQRSWSLPAFAIRRPVTVVMAATALFVVGLVAWSKLPLEFIVQLWAPRVWVTVNYPGAQPSQVEREVTIPGEGIFNTVPGLRFLDSTSNHGSANFQLRFDFDADMVAANEEIRDRVERLRARLPQEVDRISIGRFGPEDLPIMQLALFREENVDELAFYARTNLRNRLMRVPGVAQVDVSGNSESRVYVDFDQNRLNSAGVTLSQVVGMLRASSVNLGIGQLREAGQRHYVRVSDEFNGISELSDVVVSPNGLRLGDIATISVTPPPGADTFEVDRKRGSFLRIIKDAEANTVETCAAVREAIEEIRREPALADAELLIFEDQSEHIVFALQALFQAGQYGCIMAVAVLWLFLRRFRPTLVVALVIPGSLLVAPAYLYFSGNSLNIITIAAMLVSIGILVDNAIVVVENIHRHRTEGKRPLQAAIDGASEVGLAITASTLTTLVVFIPVIYLEGDELSVIMKQFAGPVVSTLTVSLILALTVIPVAESVFAPREREAPRKTRFAALHVRLRSISERLPRHSLMEEGYAAFMALILRNPLAAAAVIVAMLAATAAVPYRATGFRGEPDFDMRKVWINFDTDANFGADRAREELDGMVRQLEAHRDELGIKHLYVRNHGRGGSIQAFLLEAGDLAPGESIPCTTDEARKRIHALLPERLAGARVNCGVASANPDTTQTIQVYLKGDDTGTLYDLADTFTRQMAALPNLSGARPSRGAGDEELVLAVDNAATTEAGVTAGEIASAVSTGLSGTPLPPLKSPGREILVHGRFSPEDRQDLGDLETLSVLSSAQERVPIMNLLNIERTEAPASIRRENGMTTTSVEARTEAADLTTVRASLQRLVESFAMPPGYEISLDRNLRRIDDTLQNFYMTVLMAVILIYLLLSALFESWLLPLSVLTTVPLSFIGVYWSLYATGTPLDTISLVGSILLCGIIVNNGIVIVDHINGLRQEGMRRFEAVVLGGRHRLRPVLMTTLTTILGVAPLAVGSSSGGASNAMTALGRALVGGLTAGTLLTLFIVPLAYVLVDDARLWWRNFFGQIAAIGAPGRSRG